MSNERPGYLLTNDARLVARNLKYEPTGIRWVADYRDIDIATTNAINSAFDRLKVDENQRSTDVGRFLLREPKQRVVFGQFEDIRDFVRAVRRSQKKNVASDGEKELSKTADDLPVVNVSRPISLDFGNTDRQVARYYGVLDDQDGKAVAMVEAVPNNIQYKISIAAWDRSSIDYLVNALTSYFFHMRSDTKFEAFQTLMGGQHEVECAFIDNMAVSFDDVSAVITEQRLYAVQALITVNADMLVAWEINEVVETFTQREGFFVNG